MNHNLDHNVIVRFLSIKSSVPRNIEVTFPSLVNLSITYQKTESDGVSKHRLLCSYSGEELTPEEIKTRILSKLTETQSQQHAEMIKGACNFSVSLCSSPFRPLTRIVVKNTRHTTLIPGNAKRFVMFIAHPDATHIFPAKLLHPQYGINDLDTVAVNIMKEFQAKNTLNSQSANQIFQYNFTKKTWILESSARSQNVCFMMVPGTELTYFS